MRLRKKSCRVWRVDYTALRLKDIPQVSCSVLYVHSTYSVGMGLVTTDLATELQTMPVIHAYMVASRACLGSISRINVDYSDSCFQSFVFNEGLKLSESPARMLVPELFWNFLCSFPDASQIFHAYCRNIIFHSKFDELLGYVMIDGGHEPCLSASKVPKNSHAGSSAQISTASFLKSSALVGFDVSVILDLTACKEPAFLIGRGCYCQTVDAYINVHECRGICYFLVWNLFLTGEMEIVRSVSVQAELRCRVFPRAVQVLLSICIVQEIVLLATCERCNAQSGFAEPKVAFE